MNIREAMVATISYLCEMEKSAEYERSSYGTDSIAARIGLSHATVIRAIELAEIKGYVGARWIVQDIRDGPEYGFFWLTAVAHDDFESQELAQNVSVSTTIIVQYAQMAIAQVGEGHSAK